MKAFFSPGKWAALVFILFLTGCAGSELFNPYDDEFMCPEVGYGKCATMDQAYQESYEAHEENEMVLTARTEEGAPETTENPEYHYRDRLFREMASVIEESDTPLLLPPKISRVLVLNYSDDEETFYSSRHIYFISKGPQWILTPYEGLE
jgi:conjugal transfer pilus assembly protein TraV